jgi:uncharacterized phage infection (PIP) family protein YhgE
MKETKDNNTKSEERIVETTNIDIKDEKMIDRKGHPQECRDEAVQGLEDDRQDDPEPQKATPELADASSKWKTIGERLFCALGTLPRLPSKLKWKKDGAGPKIADLEKRISELSAHNEQLQNSISNAEVQHERVRQSCDELGQRLQQRTDELESVDRARLQTIDDMRKLDNSLLAIINDIQDTPSVEAEKKDGETLSPLGKEEMPADDLSSAAPKNGCELMNAGMESGGETTTELEGSSPGTTEIPNDMDGWGAFGRKLKRLIRNGLRFGRRAHFMKKRRPSRMERAEKRIKQFIEADSEDILPFS